MVVPVLRLVVAELLPVERLVRSFWGATERRVVEEPVLRLVAAAEELLPLERLVVLLPLDRLVELLPLDRLVELLPVERLVRSV